MEKMLANRDEEINKLTSFTIQTKNLLNEIVSDLGWSNDSVNIEQTVTCPFNSSHELLPKSLEKHMENCLWKAEGYSKDDLPLSIPSVPPDANTSIKLDEEAIEEIFQVSKPENASPTGGCRLIPRTSDRLLADFTPEERRILYDYVVSHTEQPHIGEDIADLNKPNGNENRTSSYLELLAQERNLKRRRAKHRGVHTNKKSHTEIMREVISQQMEMLSEYLAEKNQENRIESDAEVRGNGDLREHKTDARNGIHVKPERNSRKESSRDSSSEFHHRHKRNSSTDVRNSHHISSRNESDVDYRSQRKKHSKHSKSSRRDSEEEKKYKKHERTHSRERHYEHKFKSRKRSRSREDKSRKRRTH